MNAADRVHSEGPRDDAAGPGRVCLAELRETPLSVDEVTAAVSGPGVGGVVTFTGVVRDHDGGRDVTAL